MRRLNAAAFAPEALRRASPKLGKNHAERRRELAEHAEKFLGISSLLSAVSVERDLSTIAKVARWALLFGQIVSLEVCRLAGFQERMGLAGADWLYTRGRPLGCWVDQQLGWGPSDSDPVRQGRPGCKRRLL